MKLLPLATSGILDLVAGWLAQKENYQWLDFGNGRQIVTPALLKIMAQRETHVLRAYTSDRDDMPIGVVGLNGVERTFRTATYWVVAGDKSIRNRGYATFALSKLLSLGFRDLGLHSINTWVVDNNPSLRIVERLNCRFIGRQRQCHTIDGRLYDRLLFDILASEHRELDRERWHRTEGSSLKAVYEERRVQPG